MGREFRRVFVEVRGAQILAIQWAIDRLLTLCSATDGADIAPYAKAKTPGLSHAADRAIHALSIGSESCARICFSK